MSWNQSLLGLNGGQPWQAPIFGAPITDANGNTYTPITGYLPGVVFVLPTSDVTPAMQAYAGPVPAGVPVLGGEDCIALTFTDEQTAQTVLPDYWSPDE